MKKEFNSSIKNVYTKGLKLWIPADSVTYGLVPLEWRLIWVDSIEILWSIIVANGKAQAQIENEKNSDSK